MRLRSPGVDERVGPPKLARAKSARAKSARGASSVVLARELTDQLTQCRLIDLLGSLLRGKPLDLTLLLFRPCSPLAPHLQGKHPALAFDGPSVLEPLLIGERANRAPTHSSDDACFLEGLARSRLASGFALLRPALRNDPAPRFPRRDQHDFRT